MVKKYFSKSDVFLPMLVTFLFLSSCASDHRAPKQLSSLSIHHLVIFGDSLSDSGNFFKIVDRTISDIAIDTHNRPSSHGGLAFSDGPLLVEYLAEHFNTELEPFYHDALRATKNGNTGDYSPSSNDIKIAATALGGLLAGDEIYRDNAELKALVAQKHKIMAKKSSNLKLMVKNNNSTNFSIATATIKVDYKGSENIFKNTLSLGRQLKDFASSGVISHIEMKKTLFVIFIGSNDILNLLADDSLNNEQVNNQLEKSASLLLDALLRLSELGASKILVISPPNVGLSPFLNDLGRKSAGLLSLTLKNEIEKRIKNSFSSKKTTVAFYDLYRLSNKIVTNQWPANLRRLSCFNAMDFYIKPAAELLELGIEYNKNCDKEKLAEGYYPFFDPVHPSSKVVRAAAKEIIAFVEKHFNKR